MNAVTHLIPFGLVYTASGWLARVGEGWREEDVPADDKLSVGHDRRLGLQLYFWASGPEEG